MESIQTKLPVLVRALEFTQEARHRRELEQAAAAKIENPLKQQPANRVTFSQEAQTRLNEEKTHAANLVNDVRNAVRAAAAEERNKALSAEHQKTAEARVEAQNLRAEKDEVARVKAEVASEALAGIRRGLIKIAAAKEKLKDDATVRAIEQQTLQAAEFLERNKTDDFNRTFSAKVKETSDLLEKQKRTVVAKNIDVSKENEAVAVEQTQKLKKVNDRVKAETAKAMKMYQRIHSMG